jgi:hypothetical protein
MLHEIEEAIKPLSQQEKIQLIQEVAEMLKPCSDMVLRRFEQVAETTEPYNHGPLEAYTATEQLRALLNQEGE